MIGDRIRREPQIGHSQSTCGRPHQPHSIVRVGLGPPCAGPDWCVGPEQNRQRAGSRQSWQTSDTR